MNLTQSIKDTIFNKDFKGVPISSYSYFLSILNFLIVNDNTITVVIKEESQREIFLNSLPKHCQSQVLPEWFRLLSRKNVIKIVIPGEIFDIRELEVSENFSQFRFCKVIFL